MSKKFIYELPEVLNEPEVPHKLTKNARWLAGEGAGSWFELMMQPNMKLNVKRYNKDGVFECEKVYTHLSGFDIYKDYSITYPSFCNKITIVQGEKKITILD